MWLLLWALATHAPVSIGKRCAVDPSPRVGLAPVRGVVVKVMIERDDANRAADLVLVDVDGEITASALHTDVRTQWVRWANVVLAEEGRYAVLLQVYDALGHTTCQATQTITVGGPDGL